MRKIVYEIPLDPRPLIFSFTVHDKAYEVRTQYRDTDEGGWILDIHDVTENPFILVMGIPLVSGLDLLYQYTNFDFKFALLMLCKSGRAAPTFESLGVEDKLVLVTTVTDNELLLYGIGVEPTRPTGWFWPVPSYITTSKTWLLTEDIWDDSGQWYDTAIWR